MTESTEQKKTAEINTKKEEKKQQQFV